MQYHNELFNASILSVSFLYMLILFVSSLVKKNKTMMSRPFITLCGLVTSLQLITALEWLWKPGVYPRALFFFLFMLEYVVSHLATAAYYWYVHTYIYALRHPEVHTRPASDKKIMKTIVVVAVAALAMFFSVINKDWIYSMEDFSAGSMTDIYPIAFAVSCVWSIISAIELVKNHRLMPMNQFLLMLGYVIVPTVFFIVDGFFSVSLGCVMSGLTFMLIYTRIDNAQGERLLENKALLAQSEAEMTETKMELMMSQIQPHFLYNALSSIAFLCTEDPAEAERATNEFSNYLRGNLKFMGSKLPIPFEMELHHVEQYLSIEKRRFSDRLNIVYDIPCKDFLIPALTLQTLVENAVRYGVGARYEPTTVRIESENTADEYLVRIIDNGPGFDPAAKHTDDRRHIGLDGARLRLKEMVNGHLEINSVIGKGTTVIIHIPKEEQV